MTRGGVNKVCLTEEENGERFTANNGIGKEQDQLPLPFRIEIILKKFMNSKMVGWFMLEREAEPMCSTKILTLPAFERLKLNDKKISKKESGGESIESL
jgi:hypothetical protein